MVITMPGTTITTIMSNMLRLSKFFSSFMRYEISFQIISHSGSASWFEIFGAIFYMLNPLLEFGTGILGYD